MTTDDEAVAQAKTNSSPIPVAVALSKFDPVALRRDFERLSVDDITALASFPVEPHPLIGRVVAVTHCLLLSLAPTHTALELCAPPWPLLRLQLLDNTLRIWRKLRKRVCQLETGAKALSAAQVRCGCKELMPFVQPSKRRDGAWQLDRLAQISTIAASLGAWVIYCLCCSVLPSSSASIRFREITLAAQDYNATVQTISGANVSQHNRSTRRATPSVPSSPESLEIAAIGCMSSSRAGIKVGGRYLLFHSRFSSCSSRPIFPKAIHSLGEWSVYCLDANRIGRKQQQTPGLGYDSSSSVTNMVSASWWRPFHLIQVHPSSHVQPLTLSRMTQLAQQSLLLQLGFHGHVFERPARAIPYAKRPLPCLPMFTLKFNVVNLDSNELLLLAIGSALLTMTTSLADLRDQLSSTLASSNINFMSNQSSFRFLHRDSFFPVAQEGAEVAVALLPFAVLAIVPSTQSMNEYRISNHTSPLRRHYAVVAQALVNAGVSDHLAQTSSEAPDRISPPVQIFAMRQPLTTRVPERASPEISTASVIVEFFKHWRAFVDFQLLQDAAAIFQLQQRSPRKKVKPEKPSPKNCPIDTARDESVPYGPHPEPLPRKRFNSKKEWLLPLYAVVDIISPTIGVLKTPYHHHVEYLLALPSRLVLSDDEHVIHVKQVTHVATEQDAFGVNLAVFNIVFLRDESCPLETLTQLKGVYTWVIIANKPNNNEQGSTLPSKWLCGLYRFVQHPTYDFQVMEIHQYQRFGVTIPWHAAEGGLEAAFWSKDVDWAPAMASTDLYTAVLQKVFDTLCRSHPPALAVDSVKFSKLLYEAKIQPTLLTIGDAAFLFASNVTPGSAYEMHFDGFVRAMEWLALQYYSTEGKKSPSKTVPGIQHAMLKWKLSQRGTPDARDRPLSPLRCFCFEALVHLPSLTCTWREIMDSWRRARKQQLLEAFALEHCAATRIRATWLGFVSWRTFLLKRQRMKDERLAATKLQSLARGRKCYLEYCRIRRIIVRAQLRIRARCELRRLRAERVAFIERMRHRMMKWMRCHLWILREWKRMNRGKAERRERIRQKRARLLGVAVFPLESWLMRFSLYRAKPVVLSQDMAVLAVSNGADQRHGSQHGDSVEDYELEVVDATRSLGCVFNVAQQEIDRFIIEEKERLALQITLGMTTTSISAPELLKPSPETCLPRQNKIKHDSHRECPTIKRDSIINPTLKPNTVMLALARRLAIRKNPFQETIVPHCYSDPIDTSLGKLVFKGVLRSRFDRQQHSGELFIQRHVVRIFEWAGVFKLVVYTPDTSARRRYDLAAPFILSVLHFSRFDSMCLSLEGDDTNADSESQAIVSNSTRLEAELQLAIRRQIHNILTTCNKVLALQCILSYVLQYGVRTPTYSMMPHVVAERERQRKEREAAERDARAAYERQFIVKVQSRLRQRLARKYRQQLALATYSKRFDREQGKYVYVRRHPSGTPIIIEYRKPFSLFDQDVPLPPDEWQLVCDLDPTENSECKSCFFNPRRGAFSRYNNALAATTIQHWFRSKTWNGINDWALSDTVRALNYHQNVRKPDNMADPGQLENLKRFALQLHVVHHQYKAAYTTYEAALKLWPDDVQILVGLATLLVISCRYPPKQSWSRAMALLQHARDIVSGDLSTTMHEIEQNGFRWALFLQPKNPHAIANYAAYVQCVHLDIDKAELLFRRALDLDPAEELFITNYQRLRSERAPGGLYEFAGPGKIALGRSSEVCRCGTTSQWREMEDPCAQPPMPKHFFQDLRSGNCTWELPDAEPDNP